MNSQLTSSAPQDTQSEIPAKDTNEFPDKLQVDTTCYHILTPAEDADFLLEDRRFISIGMEMRDLSLATRAVPAL